MGFYRGPNIVTDGLVLSLDAGNAKSYPGSGTTWYDKSGNNYNGALTNGPTFNSDNGGSIVFDGSNDRIKISSISAPVAKLPSFSVAIWFNRGAQGDKYLYAEVDDTDGNAYWGITSGYPPKEPNLRIFTRNDSGVGEFQFNPDTINTVIYDNIWRNLVLVYDSNLITFYIDGKFISSHNWTKSSFESLNSVHIGGWQFGNSQGGYMNGNISNVNTYGIALTSQEVLQNYNATKSRFNL
jgi:hypothetical protein